MACSRTAGCSCPQCSYSLREMGIGQSSAGSVPARWGGGGGGGGAPRRGAAAPSSAKSSKAVAVLGSSAGGGGSMQVANEEQYEDERAQMHIMTNMRNPMDFAGEDGMECALEQFGPAPGGYNMMMREREAAQGAVDSGSYGVWRSMRTNEDCGRVGASSRCFCGEPFSKHRSKFPHGCIARVCDRFRYIPQRPEEVGEWWLPRRKGFDVTRWRAKCHCAHGHESHDSTTLCCKRPGCGCGRFSSAFCCLVCDRTWEDHETVFETRSERAAAGRSVDADFMPLAETPAISKLVFGADIDSNAVGNGTRQWAPADSVERQAALHAQSAQQVRTEHLQLQGGSADGDGAAVLRADAGERRHGGAYGTAIAGGSGKVGRYGGRPLGGSPTTRVLDQTTKSPPGSRGRGRTSSGASSHSSSRGKPSSSRGGCSSGGSGGSLRKVAVVADQFYSQAVREVYAAHDPAKLGSVDEILQRFAGREQQLLRNLHKKYGRTMNKRPTA